MESFPTQVEKDTANAINKASKMGEQIGVDYEDFRTDAEDRLEELAGSKSSEGNESRSGLASPNHTANLSGPVLGCIEAIEADLRK